MSKNFVRPAEYFKEEAKESFCRILSEVEPVDMRRAIYSFSENISILPPTVTNETYLIFDNDESKRQKLVDFSVAKTLSYVLFDWVVDRDLKDGYEDAEIVAKVMDEVGSQRLASCSTQALQHFQKNASNFIGAMWEERKLQPSAENYMKLLGKKSKIYNGMYGAAAIAGNATQGELRLVEGFSENFYKVSQLVDDLKDQNNNERWNLANLLGREKVEKLKKELQKKAIEDITLTRPCKHVDYLVDLVDFLYQ
jgi:hypothetical protein